MRIRWTPAAAADLEESNEYLKNKHPNYWQSTVRRLYQEILGLKDLPNRGRVGREEGTRELVFSPLPYIAVLPRKGPDRRGAPDPPRGTEHLAFLGLH
jgi:plasmid stabilization system protein ParE